MYCNFKRVMLMLFSCSVIVKRMLKKSLKQYIAKSNAFRKSAIEKEVMVVDQAKTLKMLEEDWKN